MCLLSVQKWPHLCIMYMEGFLIYKSQSNTYAHGFSAAHRYLGLVKCLTYMHTQWYKSLLIGVYLSLRGIVYTNNSVILITEIGETDTNTMPPPPNSNNGLQCITDRMPCCATVPNRFGQWQFPNNKTNIGISGSTASFYRTRGDDGTVNLNRVSDDVMMPTGLFCCIVPDATNVDQTVCANIGELCDE